MPSSYVDTKFSQASFQLIWNPNTLRWEAMQQPTLEADSVTIDLPNEGQQTMANSISVAIASDQSAVPVSDAGGSLTVDNPTLSVVGGGTEATALRVTIANDSTGLVSIDDNGGSLTVDASNLDIRDLTHVSDSVTIGDGSNTATVRNLAANDALNVAIVDGSGNQITSFGGGVQYTEGDVDASITGTAAMMEVAGNTLQPVQGTVADGLLVNLGGNNDVVVSGTVSVDDTTATGNINALSEFVEIDTDGRSVVSIDVQGTLTEGNDFLICQATIDGVNWLTHNPIVISNVGTASQLSGIETTGQFATSCYGFQKVRIFASDWVAGNVDVVLRASNSAASPFELATQSVVWASALPINIVSLPNEGQQTMANSISVAIASDQSAVPVSATNLDIRDLTSGSDSVTVVQGTAGSTDWRVDLRRGQTILFDDINATSSGDNTIIAADGTKKIKVLQYTLVADSAVTAQWKSASTALSGAMSLAANGGIASPYVAPGQGHLIETAVNQALVLTLGGAVGVRGHITYFLET